jgi:hypothetical protein
MSHQKLAFLCSLVAGAMLGGPSAGSAQSTPAAVAGVVVDTTDAPLPAITVFLRDSSGAIRRTLTDGEGRFRFAEAATGPATVTTEGTGWDPLAQDIVIPAGADVLRLALRPAGLDETVVVVGALGERSSLHPGTADLIGSVDIVNSDHLEHENVNRSYELLKKVPGVYVADFNQGIVGGGIGIRGFNTQGDIMHTTLLIDGIPANMNSGAMMLDSILSLNMDRIELVKGTNDPRYGMFNIAGNVQVFTSPIGHYTKVNVLGGAFGTGDVQGVTAFNTGRFSHVYAGGFRRSTGYRDHSDFNRYAFAGKWFYTPANNRWQLTGGVRGDRVGGEFANKLTGDRLPALDYGTIWQPKFGVLATVREGVNLYATTDARSR